MKKTPFLNPLRAWLWGFFAYQFYGLKIRLIFSTNMKTYLGHVYQPKEEIPIQLTDFKKSLDQYSSTMEDADVHIVYVGPGTELTPEYEWIKDNAKKCCGHRAVKQIQALCPERLYMAGMYFTQA